MDAEQAQKIAREVSTAVAEIPEGASIALTDMDGGWVPDEDGQILVTPTQLESAVDQYRLISGDTHDADALVSALPWA